ncbi:MAG: hypothetical protein KGZ42_05935 [Melioribacter sp.]|nr:hypothetical protein [Melioribacter sp.]
MKTLFAIIFVSIMVLPINGYAHGDKDHKKDHLAKADTFTVVNGDTIAVNGIPAESLKQKHIEAEKEKPFELNPSEQIFEHMHNKIVHFPIALGAFAFLLTLLNFKWKNFDSAILISVLISLLFSIGAFITGKNQSDPFVGTPKEWIVELHQNLGIVILINFFVWTIFLVIDKFKKYAWLIGLIAFILILITGFLGGVIAH